MKAATEVAVAILLVAAVGYVAIRVAPWWRRRPDAVATLRTQANETLTAAHAAAGMAKGRIDSLTAAIRTIPRRPPARVGSDRETITTAQGVTLRVPPQVGLLVEELQADVASRDSLLRSATAALALSAATIDTALLAANQQRGVVAALDEQNRCGPVPCPSRVLTAVLTALAVVTLFAILP